LSPEPEGAPDVLSFFDEPGNKGRQRIIKEAKAWTTYHCPDDGTNLRYSPGDTECRCTHCGQLLSLIPIGWSGQK
jgi:hypothetical protein